MAERYAALTEELHAAKRETAVWRTRHAQAEGNALLNAADAQGLRQELREARRALESVQESNHRLTLANRQLTEDRDSLASGYSTEISTIKEEIAAKQQQILELRDAASPAKIDQHIAIRQLKHDLTQEFSAKASLRDKKLEEVTAQLEKAKYEAEMEREKAKLRILALEDTLRQLQQRHQAQLLEHSNRLLQQAQIQARPNEDKESFRRAKRDNKELRRRLQLAQNELNSVLEEKNTVTRDYGKSMAEYAKAIATHQAEIEVYKAQLQTLNDTLNQRTAKTDEAALRDREREVKRLRSQLEEVRDDLLFRDKKISDLQIEKVKLLSDLQAQRQKEDSAIEHHLFEERDTLQRELSQARTALQRTTAQNLDLQDRLHDITRINSENTHRWEAARAEEDARKLKRQRSEEVIATVDKSIDNSRQQRQGEERHRKDDALSIEKTKVKEILSKYIEAKQRNAQLEKKLQKANDKIVQLLQHKIILNSPKAASKQITFPTDDPQQQHPFNSTTQQHLSPSPEKLHRHTMGEMVHRTKQPMGYTNPNLRREFFSPQEEHLIRIEDQEVNERSYYQKSLKMKHGHRFKELKCTNHDD